MNEKDKLPVHLGFIADGNRRWAKGRGLPTIEGHRVGLERMEMTVQACLDRGVKFVTFYVFSTENWNRTKEEVGYLMGLVRTQVKRLAKRMLANNARLLMVGAEEGVPEDVLRALREAEELTSSCDGGTVGVCFNYDGKREVVDALKKIVAEGKEVSEEAVRANLYCPEIPDCDMVVRTSGEMRISGFMLWRASYSEFLFLDKYWPEISEGDVEMIIEEYARRERRMGK